MKKIHVELSQVGTDIITQSSVKIRICGKFVKNELKEIIKEALEINNSSITVNFFLNTYNHVTVHFSFKNGNSKEFKIYKPVAFGNSDLNILHQNKDTKDLLQNSLVQLKDSILEMEKYIIDNSSICNNYFFEI